MAIDNPNEKIDPTCSINTGRRRFLEVSVGAVAGVSLSSLMSGCGGRYDGTPSLEGYPISSVVYTTRQWAIVPDNSGANKILPWEPSTFKENHYGLWHYVPGFDSGKNRGIMPDTYNVSAATNAASLLSFFTITDTHVYDKESPSQPFNVLIQALQKTIGGLPAITYTMLYTTHILDAAIQTVNALHKQTPFDCGLFLGDAANNSQHNEVRWYIDVIDGNLIRPSSGVHAGEDTIDYQKPFKAAGLDKTIPWYQTKGSHENFWFGSNLVDEYLRPNYIGGDILILGAGFGEPVIGQPAYYMGTVDGSTPYGNIIGEGLVSATSAIKVAADPNRRSLNMNDWMREFFDTSSNPVGHGFSQTNIDNNFASYSFEPKSDIPIKIIMLDDTQSEQSGQDSTPPNPPANYGNGSLDQARLKWLISELDQGQAEGKLMIVAAHVPIGVVVPGGGTGSWEPGAPYSCITDLGLITTLQIQKQYSNLILWLAGHQHNNQVTPFTSPDPSHPEYGFWEVQTASLRDFPQQFRTFDIVRNTDNTISIIITSVDPAVREGSPAAMSRFYALAARELYKTPTLSSNSTSELEPVTGTYNAELIKQLSPEMQTKIQSYGTLIQK